MQWIKTEEAPLMPGDSLPGQTKTPTPLGGEENNGAGAILQLLIYLSVCRNATTASALSPHFF